MSDKGSSARRTNVITGMMLVLFCSLIASCAWYLEYEFGPLSIETDPLVATDVKAIARVADLGTTNAKTICVLGEGENLAEFISAETIARLRANRQLGNRLFDEHSWYIVRKNLTEETIARIPSNKIQLVQERPFCTSDFSIPAVVQSCSECLAGIEISFGR